MLSTASERRRVMGRPQVHKSHRKLPIEERVEAIPEIYLRDWKKRGITPEAVDLAEFWVRNMSKWEVAGAFRARIVKGSLYVRMLSMHRHWAERSSVLRLLLLTVQRSDTPIEDVDIVYAHNDRDPTPPRGWPPGGHGRLIPLLTNGHVERLSSLPVPEFSWIGWHTHTPPWCQLYAELSAAGAKVPWSNRTDLAHFSGGLDNGPYRKELRKLSQTPAAAGVLNVRNVAPRFFTTTAAAKEGRDPPQPMSAMCGYKYLISVAGYGYSNRLKSLLMCGSVVIHVAQPWNEFFMPLLSDGRHLVVAKSVADIVPIVHMLRQNQSFAGKIALAGRRLAMRELAFGRTLAYFRALLSAYSSIQREGASGAALSTDGYTLIRSAADLGRLTGQCDCGPGATKFDPAKCAVDVEAYNKARLVVRNSLFRCCEGWDCPVEVCGDG